VPMFSDKTQPLFNPQADGRPITVLLLVCKHVKKGNNMLRELNINEMKTVSGGAGDGDEIITTGSHQTGNGSSLSYDEFINLYGDIFSTQLSEGPFGGSGGLGDISLIDDVTGTYGGELIFTGGQEASEDVDSTEIQNAEDQIERGFYEAFGVNYNVEFDQSTGFFYAAPLVG